MLVHPQFDPIAIHLSSDPHGFGIHWYGLMYLAGFLMFSFLGKYRARQKALSGWHPGQIDDLLFYGVLGVILGGRLGYILFYKFTHYLQNPLQILYVWEGGMSFHGGMIGVIVAMALYARKQDKHWLDITDFVAPLVPLGLLAGRLGNFINGELWGRVTSPTAPWAMIFPQARHEDVEFALNNPQWQEVLQQFGGLPRHPSQLYQMTLEGIVLFIVLWLFSRSPRRRGAVSALFLLGYGSLRLLSEFARQPDDFLGLQALGLSRGQWLCVPMILAGIAILVWSRRQARQG